VEPSSISESTNKLPGAGNAEEKIALAEATPLASPASAKGSIEVISDPYPSIRMPAKSQQRSSQAGTSLLIGRLASKVDPIYPQEALRQRLAGKVKVRVVVGQNGTIQAAALVDGPALLADAALRAVRQWRYEPTILGGAAIEVEQDITVVFHIASAPSTAD
jgi:TonB family protein